MAYIGASITKRIPWRGGFVLTSNVYHYSGVVPTPTEAQVILLKLRDVERAIYASDRTFESGKLWKHVPGDKAASEMVESVKWTGISGTSSVGAAATYKEAALMIQWPLGRYGSKNRPQFLRKWHHVGNISFITSSVQDGSTNLGPLAGVLLTYANDVTTLTPPAPVSGSFQLCGPQGHIPGSATLYPYLEHRQFGRLR